MIWWKTKKVVAVYLYDPTQEDIDVIKQMAKQINTRKLNDVKKKLSE